MRLAFPHVTALSLLTIASSAAAQIAVGSPLVNRPLNDGIPGLPIIYLGGTQPVTAPGQVAEWAFFDDEPGTLNHFVTPILFERTAPSSYTAIAIGTSRPSTSGGMQRHAFAPLAGSTALEAGKQYTVGFAHVEYTWSGTRLVLSQYSAGVVDFDGFNNFTDRWAYVIGNVGIGTVVGNGGLALDRNGWGGRIYSAQFTLSRIVAVPGCSANPPQLTASVPLLSPGTAFQLDLNAPSIPSGAWLIYFGSSFVTHANDCGIPLPGIGELLILPGSQLVLGTGALAGGSARLPLAVPRDPTLLGGSAMFQGLAAGLTLPGVPLGLTNGLWAMIAR